jgi:DNA-binding transcriptional LysR family regulator
MAGNILDGIEALAALEQCGTVSEAAIRLRLTQSAVSKRIQALEKTMGFRIVEPDGRRVKLTSEGVNLVERARPVLADLRTLTQPVRSESVSVLSLVLADSIAASWGPHVVAEALRGLTDLEVELHAHRTVLLIESVRLGRYHIGLSTDAPTAKDLIHHRVIDEPFALVRSPSPRARGEGRGEGRGRGDGTLIVIEPGSATWRAIEPLLAQHHPELLARKIVPVESFSAALQMIKAGFGDGIAPLGLVKEMRLERRSYKLLPGVERTVSLSTRKTVNQLASFQRLHEGIVRAARRYFET